MKHKVIVNADMSKAKISRMIYGHFAEHLGRCIYEGIWVGEDSPIPNTKGIRNDVLEALRQIKVPVLRWPGGCFADEYHWKDGVGPREGRKRMVNTHWGGVVENNHFGTNEFMLLCELLDCEPYISGNVGSGTVQEMSEWVEYLTFDGESPMANWRRENGREKPWALKYYGVGNENWGCGGHMRPEYYADLYRRYQTYVRNYGGNKIYKIACGANVDDFNWTEVLMKNASRYMDGLSLHYYTIPGSWKEKGSAVDFREQEWFVTMKKTLHIDELITKHSTIMDTYDPGKRVGMIIDEWGTWYDVEPGTNPGFLYQQNTIRDALVAGLHFNIFHNHAERVHMANIAQTVNVLQAMILTEGEKMLLTPTYHVFDMFKVHQDAELLAAAGTSVGSYEYGGETLPQVTVSASKDATGRIHISMVNIDSANDAEFSVELRGIPAGKREVSGTMITADKMNAHNTFEQPDAVKPVPFANAVLENNEMKVKLPAMSVVTVTVS